MSTRSLSLGVIIDYLPTDFKKFNQLAYKIAASGMESLSQITPYMEAKILHKCGWFQRSKLQTKSGVKYIDHISPIRISFK